MKCHWQYYWTRFKDKIKHFFVNRQRWLTRKIPRHWHDKDGLIEIVLFECLKNYVEGEVGKEELFDKNRWSKNDNVPKHQLQFEKELKEHYKLLTVKLVKLENDAKKAWDKCPSNLDEIVIVTKESYENKYGEVNRLEKQIDNLKDKICSWVVLNRRSLWT